MTDNNANHEERIKALEEALEQGRQDWRRNLEVQNELRAALEESRADRQRLHEMWEEGRTDRDFIKQLIGLFIDLLTTNWGRQIKSLADIRAKLQVNKNKDKQGAEE